MSLSSKVNYSFEALSGITVGNINITGNIFQNNNPYIASQWTSTSGNTVTYTSGNVIISSGGLITSGITVGNLNFIGDLYQNGSPYIGSQWTNTSGNAITYTSGNVIVSNAISSGRVTTTGLTSGILYASSSRVGINTTNPLLDLDIRSSSFGIRLSDTSPHDHLYFTVATNNSAIKAGGADNGLFIDVAAGGTGTYGNQSYTRVATFSSLGNVGIGTTLPSFNLDVNGTARISNALTVGTVVANTNLSTASLQALNASIGNLSIGNMQLSGNITVGGNVLVAGTLVSVNVTSVNLIENNITTANIVGADASFGNLKVTNWTNANFMFTNSTITNTILTNFTASNIITNSVNYGMSSTFSGSFAAANNVAVASPVTGIIFDSNNIRYFNATITVTLQTSAPSTLVAVFTIRGTYNGTWSIISSYIGDNTGITFSIDSSTGQLNYTSTNTANWTSNTFRYRIDQFSVDGTYSSVLGSTVSNYILNTLQVSNTSDAIAGSNVGGLEVVGGATIRKSLLVGNNTNIITSAGNVGFNTTSPNTSYNVDINGSMRGLRIDIGGTQPTYNNNTIGRLFITGAQNSTANGPNILITTVQDRFPTYNFLTYGHDSAWTMYDMYFDGASFRNSGSATAFMMVKENSTLKWNYNSGGFSAGAAATMTTSICIGSGGNIGLGGNVTPSYTLDVSGGARITSGLTVGNINFTGTLSQNGSPYIGSQWVGTSGTLYYGTAGSSVVGINTTSPAYTLDVSGGARITTGITAGSSTFTSVSAGNSQFSGLSAGNINFTGNLFQNGSPYIGSQWVGTSGNISFGTAGTSLVGINTTSPAFTLDVSGGARIVTGITAGSSTFTGLSSGNIHSTLGTISNLVGTNISASNINVSGTLTVVNITSTNLVDTTVSAGTLVGTTVSTANIYTSIGTVSNLVGTNLSSSNLIATVSTIPNTVSTNITTSSIVVTGASLNATFDSNTIGSIFTTGGSVGIGTTAPTTMIDVAGNYSLGGSSNKTYSTSIVLGAATPSDKAHLVVSGAGMAFIISVFASRSSAGQESADGEEFFVNWSGNTAQTPIITRYRSFSSTNSGTRTAINTWYYDSTNKILTLQTARGSSITQTFGYVIQGRIPSYSLSVQTTTPTGTVLNYTGLNQVNDLVGVGMIPTEKLDVSGTLRITSGGLLATFNSNTLGNIFTTGGNVGIGTTSPAYNLDVVGSGDFSTFVTTGALYSTNQTTTNIVATSSTITNLSVPGTLTVVNITSTNLVETNITAGGIVVTGGSLRATFNSNTIGNIFTTNGNVGIGTTDPKADFDINGYMLVNNGIRLIKSNNINYIQSGTSFTTSQADLRFTDINAGNTYFTIRTSGNIGIGTTAPAYTLDVVGSGDFSTFVTSGALYSTNQTTINAVFTNLTTGSVIANTSISLSGISSFFAGNFSGNNNVSSPTAVTGLLFPSATIRSFVTTLSINLSKAGGNLNTMITLEGTQLDSGWVLYDSTLGDSTGLVFTIDSNGQILYTSPNYAGWVSTSIRFEARAYTISGTYTPPTLATSGSVSLAGQLAVTNTSDIVSTSSGALTVSGGVGISKSLMVGANVNIGGLSNTFTGSFAAANNVSSATNVSGFLVPTATFSSFTANVNVRLITTTSTLNAQYLFEATQSTGGWLLNDTSFGDSVGITFTITSTGQIQYTSTNVANWQSTTINFAVNAISISSGFTAVLPTSGSVTISGNLTIDNTTDSSSTSSASLVLAGGAGINKSLLIGGNLNIGGVATQFAGTFAAANSASGANVTGLLFPSATIRSFSCTLSVRVVSSINYNTQHTIEGVQTATGGWQINDYQIGDSSGITFNINSSGQITYTSPTFTSWTSTTMHFNAVAYNISSSYSPIPMPTGGSSSVAGSLVIQSTDIASSTSSGALSVSGGVGIQNNLIVANNFFVTTGGNVGIGTSSPIYNLDVTGTLEASNANGLMLFASSGNVGIGTTSPSQKLHVNGNILTNRIYYTDQPHFCVSNPTAGSSLGAYMDVTFNTVVYQSNTPCWNTTSNLFTVPVAGLYQFDCTFLVNYDASATELIIALKRSSNATEYRLFQNGSPLGDKGQDTASGSILLKLAANETVKMQWFFAGARSVIHSSEYYSWFTGRLVG